MAGPFLLLFGAELGQALLVLPQPLLQLLTLGLQGADLLAQLLAGAAALLLFLQPAAGAPRHLAEPAAR